MQLMPQFINSRGERDHSRRRGAHLQVVVIAAHLLEDRQRFAPRDPQRRGHLEGLFLTLNRVPGTQLALLSRLADRDSGRVLAHEFAHYWFERALLGSQGVDTEAFARAFEQHYLANSLD